MPEQQPTYDELLAQLAEYRSLFDAMRAHQADAVLGTDQLAFIRPRDVELALRTSEEKFRTLFRSGHFAIQLSTVPEDILVEVNEAWGRLLGWPVESVVGKSWKDLGLWQDSEMADTYMRDMKEDRPIVDREFMLRSPTGEHVQVVSNANKVMLQGQEYWLTTLQDITRRRSAEAKLREADQRKDQFLATLAHELRSPLAPLSNALQILEDKPDDPQVSDQMHQLMRRQLRQLISLVDDLLDLSRVSRGVVELRRSPTRIADAIAQAIEANRPALRDKRHDLQLMAFTEDVWAHADQTRLVQIFTNLLNNAIKYTDPNGSIVIICECSEQEAVVTFRDSGIGIEPQQLARVFDMFAQVEPTSTRAHGGLGIGLSIVKQLVEMHGGDIEAHSSGKAVGSEFIVRLPRIGSPNSNATTPQMNGAQVEPLSILVVDDNMDSADTIAIILRRMGHRVHAAYNGAEAITSIKKEEPRLILMDIGMPGMDGFECCRQIRQLQRKAPYIVALTGWGQEEDKRRSADAGFDHHLVKPVNTNDLRKMLDLTMVGRVNEKEEQSKG